MFDELSGESNRPATHVTGLAVKESPQKRTAARCAIVFLFQTYNVWAKAEEFAKTYVQSGGKSVKRVRGSCGGRFAGAAVRFVG